jgi:hypothetical protein
MMTRLLDTLGNLVETWAEFRAWRADWHRTWSPASYYLAAAILVGFLAMLYFFGQDVLAYVKAILP